MKIKEARKLKKLSQAKLAEIAGLSQVAISLIETGKSEPNADTRRRLEQALGCRINWLAAKGQRNFRNGLLWEAVEGNFRKVIFDLNVLPRKQQQEFLHLAHRYLKEFENGLTAK